MPWQNVLVASYLSLSPSLSLSLHSKHVYYMYKNWKKRNPLQETKNVYVQKNVLGPKEESKKRIEKRGLRPRWEKKSSERTLHSQELVIPKLEVSETGSKLHNRLTIVIESKGLACAFALALFFLDTLPPFAVVFIWTEKDSLPQPSIWTQSRRVRQKLGCILYAQSCGNLDILVCLSDNRRSLWVLWPDSRYFLSAKAWE